MASEANKRSVGAAGVIAETVQGGIAETAQSAAGEVSSSASSLASSVNSVLGTASEAVGSVYSKAAGHVRDLADEAPASLSDAAARGQRLAQDGHHRLHNSVRSQPVEALLLAGAIGYLVGWAANRG